MNISVFFPAAPSQRAMPWKALPEKDAETYRKNTYEKYRGAVKTSVLLSLRLLSDSGHHEHFGFKILLAFVFFCFELSNGADVRAVVARLVVSYRRKSSHVRRLQKIIILRGHCIAKIKILCCGQESRVRNSNKLPITGGTRVQKSIICRRKNEDL